jgi:hypothetical protein
MVVVGNQAREDSQDGELGINDQQLGRQAVPYSQSTISCKLSSRISNIPVFF